MTNAEIVSMQRNKVEVLEKRLEKHKAAFEVTQQKLASEKARLSEMENTPLLEAIGIGGYSKESVTQLISLMAEKGMSMDYLVENVAGWAGNNTEKGVNEDA